MYVIYEHKAFVIPNTVVLFVLPDGIVGITNLDYFLLVR